MNVVHRALVDGKLQDIWIDGGYIAEAPGETSTERVEAEWDAQGLLYVPALQDMHCHLDKHLLGEAWRPLQPFVTLENQLRFEKSVLHPLEGNLRERIRRMADRMLACGTVAVRTHVDIDNGWGLSHLEAVLEEREALKDVMDIEIVAFPQQGLFRADCLPIMREAMASGADLVGGVDPAGLDRRVDGVLEAMFELAAEYDKGVDLHLHDPGHLGLYTIERMAELTTAAGLRGRTAVSHAYCFGQVEKTDAMRTFGFMKEADMTLISSVPIDRPMPPADWVREAGVRFRIGCDNIRDAWSPYGNGDLLARVSRLGERSGWVADEQLLAALTHATDLPPAPKPGDPASFMLVAAENLQQAVAESPARRFVFAKGHLVVGPNL